MKFESEYIIVCFELLLCFLTGVFSDAYAQDNYEIDNDFSTANVIVVSAQDDGTYAQSRSIHQVNDIDWVKFYAIEGETYSLKVYNLNQIDPYIELFDMDGQTSIMFENTGGIPTAEETIGWTCPQGSSGIYYAKVGQMYPQTYNEAATYDLVLYQPVLLDLPGYLTGTVLNNFNQIVSGAVIVLSNAQNSGSSLSFGNGFYAASALSGSYTINASASGHDNWERSGVSVPGNLTVILTRNNQDPVAVEDKYAVAKGGEFTGNVLSNDSDGDGDTLFAVLDSSVSHGTLQLNSDGSFTYTPDGNGIEDSFTYHATDTVGNSSIVNVTFTFQSMAKNNLPFLMLLLNRGSATP